MKKKLLLLSLTILLSTLFISCAKTPFTKSKVLQDAGLVYVYATPSAGSNMIERLALYKLEINKKATKGFIKDYEYATYDLKPGTILFSGIRNDIEKHEITLNIEAGKIYFLRLSAFSDDFGKFNFEVVDAKKAYKEMADTNLAGAYKNDDNIISSLISSEEKKEEIVKEKTTKTLRDPKIATSKTGSKLDEIKQAHEMKKQGLLTEEEFKAMKTEILAK